MEFMLIGILIGAILSVVIYFFLKRDRVTTKTLRRDSAIYRTPGQDDLVRVKEMIIQGKKIEAIKYMRDTFNFSLTEAKAFVDMTDKKTLSVQGRREAGNTDETNWEDIRQVVLDFLHSGKKISAIKYVVQTKKIGLLEAKNYVDKIEATLK